MNYYHRQHGRLPAPQPNLSVVVCTLNNSNGLDCCLHALDSQTIRPSLELIVIDDGSTEPVDKIAREHGAIVVRHDNSRGISSARNSGIQVASAPIVGFLDDDCEPQPEWAERVVGGFEACDIAVGGPLLVGSGTAAILKYFVRNNPLDPQEIDLAKSDALVYRLFLYLKRLWISEQYGDRRAVFSLASANMSVRRWALRGIEGFDERIRFGSEDEDLCRRLARAYPTQQLTFDPEVRVVHHFKPSLRDMIRRSRAYGRGSALMYRKWPNVRPTLLPFPLFMLILLSVSFICPCLLVAAALVPHLFYPKGLRGAIVDRDPHCLLDPYLQLLRESSDVCGFIEGLWQFRNFPPEAAAHEVGSVSAVKDTGYQRPV